MAGTGAGDRVRAERRGECRHGATMRDGMGRTWEPGVWVVVGDDEGRPTRQCTVETALVSRSPWAHMAGEQSGMRRPRTGSIQAISVPAGPTLNLSLS